MDSSKTRYTASQGKTVCDPSTLDTTLNLAHDPLGEDNIVVPLSLLPELRKLPDDVLSFAGAVEKVRGMPFLASHESTLIVYRVWK